jgi:hypothetical protein
VEKDDEAPEKPSAKAKDEGEAPAASHESAVAPSGGAEEAESPAQPGKEPA